MESGAIISRQQFEREANQGTRAVSGLPFKLMFSALRVYAYAFLNPSLLYSVIVIPKGAGVRTTKMKMGGAWSSGTT